jgi:hypothetical protein
VTDVEKVEAIEALRSIGELSADKVLSLCHGNLTELLDLRRWYIADGEGKPDGYYDFDGQRERSREVVPVIAAALSQHLSSPRRLSAAPIHVDLYVDVPRRGAPTDSWHLRWRPRAAPQPKSELLWTHDGTTDLRVKIDRCLVYVTEDRAVAYGHLMYPWSRASAATRLTRHGFARRGSAT